MIAVDTSAVVAIVLGESDAERYLVAIEEQVAIMSAATMTEAGIVIASKHGPDGSRDLQLLVDSAIEIVALDREHASVAIEAWTRFGKGRHSAALNLGDCYSYATAAVAGVPLLFKGTDFTQTDIRSALV